ncbi:hypothetical protein NQ315_014537 [Exocentrus adspersus]|uniref:Uncharacterized protein n=1 Tax=Exocentrus adspersus TaxID=1586481 RepID=A0AAV8VKS0_9CUCU|nr:hypothetical protein NQ315_014537 [Exocentrus adspersus]
MDSAAKRFLPETAQRRECGGSTYLRFPIPCDPLACHRFSHQKIFYYLVDIISSTSQCQGLKCEIRKVSEKVSPTFGVLVTYLPTVHVSSQHLLWRTNKSNLFGHVLVNKKIM